jgi:hypothetical protein
VEIQTGVREAREEEFSLVQAVLLELLHALLIILVSFGVFLGVGSCCC